MLPPIEHKKFGDTNQYTVRRYTRGGERRIMQGLALALSDVPAGPGILQALDGDSRYWEEVLKECLVDAPEHWWEPVPAPALVNGAATKHVSFEHVSVEEFAELTREVQAWFDSFRQAFDQRATRASTPDQATLVAAQAVPATFGGRAS